ncbi:hypothetical protein AB7M17_007876 [Bradyrhizobium sp. USDA 377]
MDRPRIYDIVRKQLADLLEGDQSYYPDGVQKDWQARADDLDGFIGSISSLRGRRDRIEKAEPSDKIELPPELSPATRDRNELYLDPNPFAPAMKTRPRPRQEWPISSIPEGATGGVATRPERRITPPISFRSRHLP